MCGLRAAALLGLMAGVMPAQLTVEQRLHDFRNLAALYAKRYAPYEWKRQLFAFDLFDIGPWLERARKAADDLEFLEVCAEYVASLDDLHSSFRLPSSFRADLRFSVDIYDGKVLIEQINRSDLPADRFPFQVGDELVSVDGKSVEEWIAEFSRLRRRGNPLSTRRGAADLITFRPQSVVPRAVDVPEAAKVVIRRESGELEEYEIPWVKSGVPWRVIGPVPMPKGGVWKSAPAEDVPDYMRPLLEMQNWRLPDGDHLLEGETRLETGEIRARRYLLGYGSRAPVFRQGFPASFVQRSGVSFHYSGTYTAGGFKIGYLRIPSFSPPSMQTAIQELDREIEFFEQNTDGLVVDVMRNPGGACYLLDVAARLIPYDFFSFGEEVRVTLDRINSINSALESARRARAEPWVIATYTSYLEQLQQAYREYRGRTGPLPLCSQFGSGAPAMFENKPARVVYTKPLIVLIDEFSTSAADIFSSIIQDNGRGPLVGVRTNGAGGSTSTFTTGFFSETSSSNTNTLVVRRKPIVTPDYPTASYIENIGVRPDIPLNYMTRENLLNNGRPFVEAFTGIMIEQIRAWGR